MKIKIDWQKPILLFQHKRRAYADEVISDIEDKAGVYFFARKHGNNVKPFYIGETLTLRTRLKQHLKSAKIMDALRGIENPDTERIAQGSRFFHYGYLSGDVQNKKKRLEIVQRYLIDEALSMQLVLLNKHGTEIRTHTLVFDGNTAGRGVYPRSADVEE